MAERITPDTFEWDLLYAEHAQRYEHFAPLCKGLKTLDAACGAGFGSQILFRAGAASVAGVDLSPEAVALSQSRYGAPGISFRTGDCEALETLGEKFDAIVSFETLEHLKNPERLVAGARKILNPGGLFICSTPNILRHSLAPGNTYVNPYHHSEMRYADFEALMARHFTIESRHYQDESPSYLRYQAMVQMILSLQNSFLWRMENKLRALLGKPLKMEGDPIRELQKSVTDDYEIGPIGAGCEQKKTFIIVGRAT